jgi:hypothetical protein
MALCICSFVAPWSPTLSRKAKSSRSFFVLNFIIVSKGDIQLMSASGVSIKNLRIRADIGTQLQHFRGLSGLRCALEVGLDIEISTGEESKIVIRVTGIFEEVRVSLNVSGGAVWGVAWIFPYIKDYRMNANLDLYNFTSVDVNATISTMEKREVWEWDDNSIGLSIAKELKELLNAKAIGDGTGTIADGLVDRYRAMLQNESDWVELFSQDIFTQEGFVDPFHILVYEISLKFVVSANMNISIGCSFYYENAKRYNYSLGLLSKKCTNDVIDLVEEHYEFSFYVMGTMGLRAGIRLEIKVGLFSLELDSIGLSAEVGVYVRVWGYFYYELTYRAYFEGTVTNTASSLSVTRINNQGNIKDIYD